MPARVKAFLHQVNVSHFSFSNRIKKLELLLFQENTYGSYQRFLSVIIVYCTWLFFMLLTLHPGCTGSWRLPPALRPTLIAFLTFFTMSCVLGVAVAAPQLLRVSETVFYPQLLFTLQSFYTFVACTESICSNQGFLWSWQFFLEGHRTSFAVWNRYPVSLFVWITQCLRKDIIQ